MAKRAIVDDIPEVASATSEPETASAPVIPVKAAAPFVPAPEPEPEVVRCQDCRHWSRARAPKATFGECNHTRSFSPSPIWTTDLTTCSAADR